MIVIEILAAVTTVVFAVLPAKGIIRRNAFVGVRTRATMRDDVAWRRAHQAAVLPTSVAAAVTTAAATVFILTGRMNDLASVMICAIPLGVGALWSVVTAGRAVR